uniref:NADH-ubiquinone oxidoreductase chain 2 n=1 Tax=Temnopleurus toreumaticus TaxID=161058 RepID=A0A1L6Z737_9ECHN|nr:NADH dehydrogenase subunit 2 [Temnopleurus toreumaticus]APT42098.1 NADH dehydrogenase subunit 2 [Temnopleurus toreumaticus]
MSRTISILLFLTVILGTFIVLSSQNWFVIWIGLEISTLALIPLLCANFSPRNIEASIKYFLIQALSAALLLNGAMIQAWVTGSWSILDPANNVTMLCISIALAFKIGLAPCHFWFPDVLQGLPFLQGLIIATWQKIAPIILILSIVNTTFSTMLLATGLISIIVGGWGGLNQTQTRKILAFSSIANMGWIVITSIYSTQAAIIMLIIYLLINTAMFLLLDLLTISSLGHLNNTAQLSPISIVLITLLILSLGGLPPLTGFMLKFTSLYFLIANNFIILSSIMIIGSLLSLFFYLRVSFNVGLILFPQHIISLTAWRNNSKTNYLHPNTWLTSTLATIGIFAIPITLPLYIII